MEVPITITSTPGALTPAPGTETNESTFPTATAVDSGRPTRRASSARSVPARVPSGTNSSPSFSAGLSKPGYASLKKPAEGSPPLGDHIAL